MKIINGNKNTISIIDGNQELYFEFDKEHSIVRHTFKFGRGLADHYKVAVMSSEEVLDMFNENGEVVVVRTPTGNKMDINKDMYNKIINTLKKAVKL